MMNDYQNGYQNGHHDEKRQLDEDAFGSKAGNIVSAFDAFRGLTQFLPRTPGLAPYTLL
jgi:hypothetical protein